MEKDAKVNFRITESQKEKVKAKAEELGMSVSEYLRYLITKHLEDK